MPDFALPDLGEGLTEAEIVAWHVAVGDEVHVDQTVVEVETAKASVEVPIPFAGKVSALHGKPGDLIVVGAPLISVGAAEGFREPGVVTGGPQGSSVDDSGVVVDGSLDDRSVDTGSVDEGSGNVLIGYGTSTATRRRGRRGRAPQPVAAHPGASTEPRAGSRTIAVVSPLVRRLARESGLDLTAVHGTGPSGLIMRRDVEQAVERAAADHPSASEVAAPRSGSEQRIPLRGARKVAADRLARSRREIPEATVWVDVDATALLEARAAINARRPEEPVSLLALLARFTIAALHRYPELNGRVEGDEIVLPSAVGLGFAAQTDRGLVVPVVHDAQALSLRELSAAMARLTGLARDGRVGAGDLRGGSFTVNNYGVFGVDGSAAIINHPEVAILGIGRIIDRPWVVGGQLAVRKVTELTLAFDHRVCDGGTAGGFLRYVADCVESPVSVLADL